MSVISALRILSARCYGDSSISGEGQVIALSDDDHIKFACREIEKLRVQLKLFENEFSKSYYYSMYMPDVEDHEMQRFGMDSVIMRWRNAFFEYPYLYNVDWVIGASSLPYIVTVDVTMRGLPTIRTEIIVRRPV